MDFFFNLFNIGKYICFKQIQRLLFFSTLESLCFTNSVFAKTNKILICKVFQCIESRQAVIWSSYKKCMYPKTGHQQQKVLFEFENKKKNGLLIKSKYQKLLTLTDSAHRVYHSGRRKWTHRWRTIRSGQNTIWGCRCDANATGAAFRVGMWVCLQSHVLWYFWLHFYWKLPIKKNRAGYISLIGILRSTSRQQPTTYRSDFLWNETVRLALQQLNG